MKKVLMVIGGIVVGIIVLVVAVFLIVSVLSDKLVCKSSKGNITIMYSDKELTGYTTSGDITFDLDGQNTLAKELGTTDYIKQFVIWFETNTDGTCE